MKEIQIQKQYQSPEAIQAVKQILESEEFSRIQNGERNEAFVASLQTLLITDFNYDLGNTGTLKNGIDGDFGDLTAQAVEDFKTKYFTKIRNNTPKTLATSSNIDEHLVELGSVLQANFGNKMLSLGEIEEIQETVNKFPDNLRSLESIQKIEDELTRLRGNVKIRTQGLTSSDNHEVDIDINTIGTMARVLNDQTSFNAEIKAKIR